MCVLRWFVLVPWCTVCLSTWLAVWDLILLLFTMWLAVRELILLQFAMLKWVSVCVCVVCRWQSMWSLAHTNSPHTTLTRCSVWQPCLKQLTYTHTTVQQSFVQDSPGRPVPEETFTHSHPSWSSDIFINFLHLLRSIASSVFSLRAWQPLSRFSLVFLLVWDPLLHTPCISSCNHQWFIIFFSQHMPIPTTTC